MAIDTGRTVGRLLVVQLAGLIVPFVLLLPLVTSPGAYLDGAAPAATRILAGVVLLLGNGALTIGLSITAWPDFRRASESLAMWLIVLGALMLAVQVVDNVHILSMLSLSQAHATSGADADHALAVALGTTRRWAHLSELLVIDAWILTFYLNLARAAAVPRALVAFGLLTVAMHFAAIPVPGFLGFRAVAEAGMPMALSHLATGGWLALRGFAREP